MLCFKQHPARHQKGGVDGCACIGIRDYHYLTPQASTGISGLLRHSVF